MNQFNIAALAKMGFSRADIETLQTMLKHTESMASATTSADEQPQTAAIAEVAKMLEALADKVAMEDVLPPQVAELRKAMESLTAQIASMADATPAMAEIRKALEDLLHQVGMMADAWPAIAELGKRINDLEVALIFAETGAQQISITGDATGQGTTSISLKLANSAAARSDLGLGAVATQNYVTNTFNPAPVANTNIASIGAVTGAKYTQIGNKVFYEFAVSVTATAASAVTAINFTYPVNQTNPGDVMYGHAYTWPSGDMGVVIDNSSGTATTGYAQIKVSSTAAQTWYISGSYTL